MLGRPPISEDRRGHADPKSPSGDPAQSELGNADKKERIGARGWKVQFEREFGVAQRTERDGLSIEDRLSRRVTRAIRTRIANESAQHARDRTRRTGSISAI